MNKLLSALTGFGLGSTLTYIFDSRSGRARRARMRDEAMHVANKTEVSFGKAARDVFNRSQGTVAKLHPFKEDVTSDEIITQRVRSKLGRYVSHPHSVQVSVKNGRVTLSGLIFLNEVRRLMKHVSSISGVSEVDNQLEEHSSDDHIPGLQGGYYKPGERLDILQTNWAPSTRVFAGFFGTSLLGLGIRRGGLLGALSVMTGTVLGTRAITNKPAKTLFSLLGRKAVHIRRTIRISVPIDQVFEFFSDPINFRSFMNGLKDVRQIEKHRYLFTSEGVKNSPITWHAVVTDLISNHLIIWKSVRPAMINNWGMIRLHLDGRDQTIVQLQMAHYPPRGLMAEFASRLFGVSTKSNLDQSLDQIRKDLEKGQKRFSLVA